MTELSDYRRLVSDPMEQRLRARIAALEEGLGPMAEAWSWLATQTALSLDYEYGEPDDDAGRWEVRAEHGGVNDREWRLISTGATPLEAVRKAHALLSKGEGEKASEGGGA